MANILKPSFLIVIILFSCSTKQPDHINNNGSVATAHPLATQAGHEILATGGNAFDAAIAIAATLNVVEPMMSGIGGYGTILIYDAENKQVRFLNPSGRFPFNSNADLMRAPTPNFMENRFGPKAISTPGNLNAWKAMHDAYGSLEWDQLFESAIAHAEKGFRITPFLATMIDRSFSEFSDHTQSFYGNNGQPLKERGLLIQKDLANTFKDIKMNGVESFYRGEMAKIIDEQMRESGSFLTLQDLENNEAEWWAPLKFNYRGFDVYTASLPANSFPAFVNLGVMQEVAEQELKHNSVEYLHLLAEMTKESYKSRLKYSFDPDIQEAPIDSILSQNVLSEMAAAINREHATAFEQPFSTESKNTTHYVVIDKWGNIVSSTQTLGGLFGSKVMVEGLGVWMNGSMAYATFEPKGNPMDVFPGRHKLSGDCPIIIMKDDQPWAALGSPGGHTITQNVPQIIFNLIDFEMDMQEAISAPKISFVEPNYLLVDHHLDSSIVNLLADKGHQIRRGRIGNATGIRILYDNNGNPISFDVGIDQRGEGKASIVGVE